MFPKMRSRHSRKVRPWSCKVKLDQIFVTLGDAVFAYTFDTGNGIDDPRELDESDIAAQDTITPEVLSEMRLAALLFACSSTDASRLVYLRVPCMSAPPSHLLIA
jgi:hypothetical protein